MQNKVAADIELANNTIQLCKNRVDQCDPSPEVLKMVQDIYQPKIDEVYKKITSERDMTNNIVKRIYQEELYEKDKFGPSYPHETMK